jgi:hypothetical protein
MQWVRQLAFLHTTEIREFCLRYSTILLLDTFLAFEANAAVGQVWSEKIRHGNILQHVGRCIVSILLSLVLFLLILVTFPVRFSPRGAAIGYAIVQSCPAFSLLLTSDCHDDRNRIPLRGRVDAVEVTNDGH